MRELWFAGLSRLRYEPTEMRVRVRHDGVQVADTTRAVLVWEPRQVVPSYAVPVADLGVELEPSPAGLMEPPPGILHPGIPFAAHSAPGQAMDLVVAGNCLVGAGYRLEDAELAEYVVLDFKAFDEWFEEEERLVSHPREPYHRVDVRPSTRTVRVESDGVVLAESSRPTLVFETALPTRFYLPPEDVVAELEPSSKRTACAYKGHATYYSVDGHEDLLWTYLEPLHEAAGLTGLISFYDDLVDVYLDGVLRERPDTPVSRTLLEESRPQG